MQAERQREAAEFRAEGDGVKRSASAAPPTAKSRSSRPKPPARAKSFAARARPREPHLRRGLRQGSGLLRLLPLDAGLSGGAEAGDTKFVLCPDSEFFQYFNNSGGKAGSAGPSSPPPSRPRRPTRLAADHRWRDAASRAQHRRPCRPSATSGRRTPRRAPRLPKSHAAREARDAACAMSDLAVAFGLVLVIEGRFGRSPRLRPQASGDGCGHARTSLRVAGVRCGRRVGRSRRSGSSAARSGARRQPRCCLPSLAFVVYWAVGGPRLQASYGEFDRRWLRRRRSISSGTSPCAVALRPAVRSAVMRPSRRSWPLAAARASARGPTPSPTRREAHRRGRQHLDHPDR